MALASRSDPYLSCDFLVEIDALVVAGFSDVTGLAGEIEVFDYREGGVNEFVHRFPGPVRYPANIVLRRGVTEVTELWDWWQQSVRGATRRRDTSILLLDAQREVVCRWEVIGAYPVKWSGPELRAQTAAVAVESVELAHRGLGPQR